MKTTLLALALAVGINCSSQAVLNEIYTDPGSGNQEFFELFNTSTSTTPESLDNYTLVTYYEESGKTGFYVFDLPAQSINARGFWVGASSLIFNVQGQANLVANTSWNLLLGSTSLTKWEKSGTSYIQRLVPLNLNDLFVRTSGSGGAHHIFLFKNGVLTSSLIAAISASAIPLYIRSMPNLFVNMSSSSPDFTINWSGLSDSQVEYCTPNTGSDNGYIREYDGACGVWLKSTSQDQHTPGYTNGVIGGQTGQLTITSSVTFGALITDPSYLNYNITAGSASLFPVTVEAYRDLGTIGSLDNADILFDSRSIINASQGVQTIQLPNPYEQVILVLKTPAGCFDDVKPVPNYRAVLSVSLISFNAGLVNRNAQLEWTTEGSFDKFVIEKSIDGGSFQEAGIVMADNGASGYERYQFTDNLNSVNGNNIVYRLRLINAEGKFSYSPTKLIKLSKTNGNLVIQTYPNPVINEVRFTIPSEWQSKNISVELYNVSGNLVKNYTINAKGQTESMNLQSATPGLYLLKLSCNGQAVQQKIIKQ